MKAPQPMTTPRKLQPNEPVPAGYVNIDGYLISQKEASTMGIPVKLPDGQSPPPGTHLIAGTRYLEPDDNLTKGEGPGHPFRGNQWTGGIGGSGTKYSESKAPPGSKANPLRPRSVDEAVAALQSGKHIHYEQPRQVSTLLDKLAAIAIEARAKGEKAPNYNLCNVTVTGTNLFCVKHKGKSRLEMPQLKGKPTPGSKADKLERNKAGEVDLGPEFRKQLAREGIDVDDTMELASYLHASQTELQGEKVGGMMVSMDRGTMEKGSIFISRDNYVVDGHHRWAAAVGIDVGDNHLGDVKMDVARIDMPIVDLLIRANAFAEEWGIPPANMAGVAAKSRVRKWLAKQMRTGPPCVDCDENGISKGEGVGHPFRGNQWTGGIGSTGASTDFLPPTPGSTPIPEGAVRLFHYTSLAAIPTIREQGLTRSSARGHTYGEPDMVWATAGTPKEEDFYNRVYVEFWVDPKELDIGGMSTAENLEARRSSVTLFDDLPASRIIAIHEPWQAHYRYLEGERDYLLDPQNQWMLRPNSGDPQADRALTEFARRHGIVTKGEGPGHPFRGNQHTGGIGGSGNVSFSTTRGAVGTAPLTAMRTGRLTIKDNGPPTWTPGRSDITRVVENLDMPMSLLRDPALVDIVRNVGGWQFEPGGRLEGFHTGTNHTPEEWAAFKADIESRGLEKPITVAVERDGRLTIIDGTHRIAALYELGAETVPVRELRYFANSDLSFRYDQAGEVVGKGEGPGHPFRGNQHTGGIGGSGIDADASSPTPLGDRLTALIRQDSLNLTGGDEYKLRDEQTNWFFAESKRRGYTSDQSRAAWLAVDSALDYSSDTVFWSRSPFAEAVTRVRAGHVDSDLERGVVIQKAYTDAVWKAKYGNTPTIPISRVEGRQSRGAMSSWTLRSNEAQPMTFFSRGLGMHPEEKPFLHTVRQDVPKADVYLLPWGDGRYRSDYVTIKGEVLVHQDPSVVKGEASGHPFRGNQWTGGIPGMLGRGEVERISPHDQPPTPAAGRAGARPENSNATRMSGLTELTQARLRRQLREHSPNQLTQAQIERNLESLFVDALRHDPQSVINGKTWYHEAQRAIDAKAAEVGLDRRQARGLTAALSPQNQWGQNLSGARFLMDTMKSNPVCRWTEAEKQYFASKNVDIPDGKRFNKLDSTDAAWALMVLGRRVDLRSAIPTPTGHYSKVAWSCGTKMIARAIEVGRGADVDKTLAGHKVRSFFNNLTDPHNHQGFGDVTIDTHAVSAAAGMRFAAQGPWLKKMFQSVPSIKEENIIGTYAIFADAFRNVARLHGMEPNQMQATLWLHWQNVRFDHPAEPGHNVEQDARHRALYGIAEQGGGNQ